MSSIAAPDLLLEVSGIEVVYNRAVQVLRGLSLTVPRGQVVALLGSNGAGKSTTLKAVSRLLEIEDGTVTGGAIWFAGQDVATLAPHALARRGLFHVMEGRRVFEDQTVEENLTAATFALAGRKAAPASFDLVYDYFPRLRDRRSGLAGYLSGGEQQMLAIGRALVADPLLILLDEPSLGLSPMLVEEIFTIIARINRERGTSMLLVEQNAAVAVAVSDRIGLGPGMRHLSYLPLCHVAEQMLTTMAAVYVGFQVNFGESIRTVQEDLREIAPDIFLGVPRIWEKLHSAIHVKLIEAGGLRLRLFERALAACAPFAEVALGKRSLSQRLTFALYYALLFRSLLNFIGLRRTRIAMTGAAPIPAGIVRFFRTIDVPLIEAYGATETSGIACAQHLDDLVPLCVGPAAKGVELARGAEGELLVRGETVFAGYYRNEDATRASRTAEGWLRTGDVVEIVGGHFRIVDRLKDILITAGGKNLSPSEIENTVKASPFIKECIVIGDGRSYVSALIQIDPETVGQWAEGADIAYTHFRSLAEHPRVRALIEREVGQANAELAPVSHVRRFHLLAKELDHDDDEVTATMKIRRSNIQAKYASEIQGLYAPA